jgi:CRISPR/Cas system CMR-associated protein Cmr5 small subunit
MKNLDQIRAHNALQSLQQRFRGQADGEVIRKIPAYILNDGLLATLAFGIQKGGDHQEAGNVIARHLSSEGIEIYTPANGTEVTGRSLLETLASQNSDTLLRRATAESLAFLSYLKRFVA